jgi:hypothetical protein
MIAITIDDRKTTLMSDSVAIEAPSAGHDGFESDDDMDSLTVMLNPLWGRILIHAAANQGHDVAA